MQHDANAVNTFISKVLEHIKTVLPNLTFCYYFSDGAASQYKNYKTLSNLFYHFLDHGIHAEWHFFATSHGKSPCDGIGGIEKRLVARTSLQNNEILSVEEMFKWCKDNIKGINYVNVTRSGVTDHIEHHNLEERYTTAKRLPGTRSHHSFVPRDGKL